MTNGRDDPLDQLTFSQRYGYDPIPGTDETGRDFS